MIYLGDQLPFPTSSSIAIHPGLVLKQCRLHRTLSTEVLPQTGLLYTLYIYMKSGNMMKLSQKKIYPDRMTQLLKLENTRSNWNSNCNLVCRPSHPFILLTYRLHNLHNQLKLTIFLLMISTINLRINARSNNICLF